MSSEIKAKEKMKNILQEMKNLLVFSVYVLHM